MYILIQEILNFIRVGEELAERIAESPYKKEYIIQQTNNSPATFYRKLKNKSFSPDELLGLAKILVPEEYYRWEFEKELEAARAEESVPLPERLSPVVPKK